jgi:protein-tyrosine phosphatase
MVPETRTRILFVCTGNTCRSPLAEALGRRELIERGLLSVEVSSAGISAANKQPASDGSMLVGLERHLDLGSHQARQLTPAMVAEATLILVMGAHHLNAVEKMGGNGKAVLLTQYAEPDRAAQSIPDPFGGDLDTYRETADALAHYVRLAFDRIEAGEFPAV